MKRFLLCLTLVLITLPAWAERRALIIGNAGYSELPALANTLHDTRAYRDALAALGFEVSYHEDLDERAMDAAIAGFLDRIVPGDEVALVYAGHGWSDEGINYILPVDAPREGSARMLARRSIPLKNGVTGVLDEISAGGVDLLLAVVDACPDNPFARHGTRSVGASRGLARIAANQGSFVVFSAGEGQAALDRLDSDPPDQRLSVFTRHFLPLLARDLYLEDAISEAQVLTARAAASQNHIQTPAYYDQTLGKTCLHDNCATPAAAVAAPDEPPAKPSWQVRLDVPGLDIFKARDAIAMADGGVLLAYGYREFPGTPPWTGLARISGQGDLLWDKRLEALKNKDEETFLVSAALLPWRQGVAVYQAPGLVAVDAEGRSGERVEVSIKDHFLSFPFPTEGGGFVITGDGPRATDRFDIRYKFIAMMEEGAKTPWITAEIAPDDLPGGDAAKLFQTQLMPAYDGGAVHQVSLGEFRGYTRDGKRLWQRDVAAETAPKSVSFVPLNGVRAMVARVTDMTRPQGAKIAELDILLIDSDGDVVRTAGERLRFDRFAPSAKLHPIRGSNGAILELISSDNNANMFWWLDAKGQLVWTRNFGAKNGMVIPTFANRGKTGAVFLDFRTGDNRLGVIALDDDGQL